MKITHITYINLDFRTDKFNHINNQLLNCDIPYFKTNGVICEDYRQYPVEDDDLRNNEKRYKGTIGCFLSHIKAINNFIQYNTTTKQNDVDSYFMVLEDDVNIDVRFWHYLFELKTNSEFDFIFFDNGRKLDASKSLDFRNNLWPIYEDYPTFCGAFCYAISCLKLNKIIDTLNKINLYKDFDRFIFNHDMLYNVCYQTNLISVNPNFRSDRDPTHSWELKN